jgi:serine protease Do
MRDDDERVVTLTTSVFPEELAMKLAFRQLGITVADITEKDVLSMRIPAGSGVIVAEIDPHCALAGIGVRPGDIIRQINETDITSTDDFKKAVIKYRWKESLVILVQRGGHGYYLTVKTPYGG